MNNNFAQPLSGKKGLITGVANNMSISWAIAQAAAAQGASLGFTYQSDILAKRVTPLFEQIGGDFIEYCDVTDEASMDKLFQTIENKWGKLDFLVHSMAFSHKNELQGRYINTSLANFQTAMQVSCYSLTALARRAEPLMQAGSSILTLSYYGAEKVVPHYNVMGLAKAALECSVKYLAADMGPNGIRVNAISAGPIKTLAASAISDFKTMLSIHAEVAPLRRNTTVDEVAYSAVYLLNAQGVTGEIHYVDCGYNVIGMSYPVTQ